MTPYPIIRQIQDEFSRVRIILLPGRSLSEKSYEDRINAFFQEKSFYHCPYVVLNLTKTLYGEVNE